MKGSNGFDQKGALSTAEVCDALGLSEMRNRKWHVQGAIAIRGEGLYEGLDWCAFVLTLQVLPVCIKADVMLLYRLASTLKNMVRSGQLTSVEAVQK